MKQEIKQVLLATVVIFGLTSCRTALTQTPTVEFTQTTEPTFTTTFSPTNTPSLISTSESKTNTFYESTSRDGVWSAIVTLTTTDATKDLLFVVSNNLTDQKWIVEQININETENPPPGGSIYPYIFTWSQDNNCLYYSHLSTGGDGCFGLRRPGGHDLKRLDLTNGNVINIHDDGGTWMALSPDEKKLAYINTWGGDVYFLDIDSKKELLFPLPQ